MKSMTSITCSVSRRSSAASLRTIVPGRRTASALGVLVWAFILAPPAHAALQISSQASSNVVCSGKTNTCTATARNAVLNARHLARLLARHDVTVSSGRIARDVVLSTSFSWSSAYALTLDAHKFIRFDDLLSVVGPGALVLHANDRGGLIPALSFHRGGRVAFSSRINTLVINNTEYSLAASITELARAIAANPSGNYALANNYDASADGTYASSAISTPLSGTVEGLGNAISNLAISDQTEGDSVGLIAQVSAGGIVSNMTLTNANVSAGGAKSIVGALVAINAGGTVKGSNSAEVVTAGDKSAAGGLVGFNEGGFRKKRFLEPVVSDCHAVGSIAAGDASYVGGLIGADNGIVIGSSASGEVSAGKNSLIGGLVGYSEKRIEQSYAAGSASGEVGAWVGGLAGLSFGPIIESYAYVSLDAAGSKKDPGNVGGLVGYAGGQIVETYSAGMVSGTKSSVGGLLGIDVSNGNNFTSYWDFDTSGITDPSRGAGNIPNDPGITGLSNAQFQSALPPYFDPAVWAENSTVNGGLPYLINNRPK